MDRVKRLVQSYSAHISVPWRADAAAAQRVIFCVYKEDDELRLRARVEEFELVTRQAGHDWTEFDLTDSFPTWITTQRYAKSYFRNPELLSTLLPQYLQSIATEFSRFLEERQVGPESVVVLKGVGSLFGFMKVKDLIDELAPMVTGRLLVFFPGSYENNNYRLLDGYDGWNYLAVPISSDRTV